MNLDTGLGQGQFGFLTHGPVVVNYLAAREQYEVYKVRPAEGAIIELRRGTHRLWVELNPESGVLDSVRFEPTEGE